MSTWRRGHVIKINLPLKDGGWHGHYVDDGVCTRGRNEKEEHPKDTPYDLGNKGNNTILEEREKAASLVAFKMRVCRIIISTLSSCLTIG